MPRHTRRAPVEDTLKGQSLIQPARLAGPGLQAPRMPVPKPSMAGNIAAELGEWADTRLTAITDAQNQRSMMDGAIAATQGQALDDLEIAGGDKWALEGHRVITAQSVSSQLQAAQIQLIEDSAFALGPDQYRAQLTEQLAGLTDGQDPETARMIQEQSASWLPELVGRQTAAHANFQEGQTFDAVIQSLSAMSNDPQGQANLLDMATMGGAASGLSDARFKQALMEGIVLGFVNGNPRPYGLMKSNGLMSDMTTDQINRIEDAEKQWQSKLKQEINVPRMIRLENARQRLMAGEIEDPLAYAAEVAEINAQFHIDSDFNSMKGDYGTARDPVNTLGKTRRLVADEARLRGDIPAFAAATASIIMSIESSADDPIDIRGPLVEVGANKGDRARGWMQVMTATLLNPGFGVRPWDRTDEDAVRAGKDYWEAMLMGTQHPSGVLRYEPMDIESAAIAYFAGPGSANKWFLGGKDYSVLPQPENTREYAAKAVKKYNDMKAPLVGDRFNIATHNLKVTTDRVDAENYALATQSMAVLDRRLLKGDITHDVWLGLRRQEMDKYGVKMTTSIAKAEQTIVAAKLKAAEETLDLQQMSQITAEMFPINAAFDAILSDPSIGQTAMLEAISLYAAASSKVFADNGLVSWDKRNTAQINAATKRWISSVEVHEKWQREQTEIELARQTQTVDQLKPELLARHHEQRRREEVREAENQLAMSDGSEADLQARDQSLTDAQNNRWKDDGAVEPRSRQIESSLVSGPRVMTTDNRGQPTVKESAVQSAMRYREFKNVAPELSGDFYDLPGQARVEAVLTLAGAEADEASIKQAFFDIVQSEALNRTSQGQMDAFMRAEETVLQVEAAIDGLLETEDIGLLQAITHGNADKVDAFTVVGSEVTKRKSAETRDIIRSGLAKELRALKLATPYIDADMLAPLAMERLMAHSAFIGGSFVITDMNLLNAVFGGQQNAYAKVGIINDVFVTYLSSNQARIDNPEIDDSSFMEFFPRWMQDIAAAPEELFGFDSAFNKGMTMEDFMEVTIRGVRPYTASLDVDGSIVIRVMNHQGVPGEPITFDRQKLRLIGDFYKKEFPNTPEE